MIYTKGSALEKWLAQNSFLRGEDAIRIIGGESMPNKARSASEAIDKASDRNPVALILREHGFKNVEPAGKYSVNFSHRNNRYQLRLTKNSVRIFGHLKFDIISDDVELSVNLASAAIKGYDDKKTSLLDMGV